MEQSAEAKKKNSSVLIVGVTGRLGFELANASLEASHPTYCLVRPTSFSDPEKSRKLQILTDSGAIIIEVSSSTTVIDEIPNFDSLTIVDCRKL